MTRPSKTPTLTAARLVEILDYNCITGMFAWKISPARNIFQGDNAGYIQKEKGYLVITIDGAPYMAHRLAWLYAHGRWPLLEIDHIDGNKANNAISNLRDVSRGVNCQNLRSAPQRNTTSKLLGAYPSGKRWRARITINQKIASLGTFATKEDAHSAYLDAKRIHHEGCTI